jgi:hypothetical protein
MRAVMIQGIGDLVADGKVLGKAEYEIEITSTNTMQTAKGVIHAEPWHVDQAFAARECRLVRGYCGYSMHIVVRTHGGDSNAPIVVKGSPGPLPPEGIIDRGR